MNWQTSILIFSLDLGMGGLFLACANGQSPYCLPIKKKKIYLEDNLPVVKQMWQTLKGRSG